MANTKKYDIGELFSGKRSGSTVVSFKDPSPSVPQVDSDYLWPEWTRDVLVWMLMDTFQPLYVFGPSGCGKSSCLRQVCAKINMPVLSAVGSERLEVSDLLGHYILKDHETQWIDGPLVTAYRNGFCFILDEIDSCSPSILMALHGILDGSDIILAEHGGERISRNPLFRIAVTGNTSGLGDSTGHFVGTAMQNAAFLDRFLSIEAAYPSPEAETALLTRKFPQLPRNVIDTIVRTANKIRKLFINEEQGQPCEITVTTRSLLRWAYLTLRYEALSGIGLSPLEYAADLAFANRASKPTKLTVHELIQRLTNEPEKETK